MEKVPAEKNSIEFKSNIEFPSNACKYLACGFGQKANKICFAQSQFYRCTDLHATYRLAARPGVHSGDLASGARNKKFSN